MSSSATFQAIIGRAGLRRFIALFLALLVFSAPPAEAQTALEGEEPFASWNATAAQAEQLLESEFARDEELERIRAELAAQREVAFDLAQESSVSARAIEAQLQALGPPPGEDETEPDDVAARRAELTEELSQENAPTLAARESYQRAELLVSEIDSRLRATQTEQFLERLPSPLLPTNWIDVPAEISDRTGEFISDLAGAVEDEFSSGRLLSILPISLALLIAGLSFILILSPWLVGKANARRDREPTISRRRLLALGGFFAQFAIPLLGLILVFVAPAVLGLVAHRGQAVVESLPTVIAIPVIAHLVGTWIFGSHVGRKRFFGLDAAQAAKGYRLGLMLGVFLAIESFLVVSETNYHFSRQTRSVLSFVVLLVGIIPLWQLGQLLTRLGAELAVSDGELVQAQGQNPSLSGDMLRLAAFLLQIAAALALVAAAIGYVNLARQAVAPMVVTLAVIGVAIHLRALLVGVLRGTLGETTEDEAEDAFLIPFLVSLTLVFATAPILALVWGARPTDLAEVWRLLTDGVELGETRVSLTTVFTLAIVFALGLAFTRWLQRLFRRVVLPRTRMDRGAQSSLVTGMGYVGLTLTALIAISSAGINLASLAVVFGALSVGIGFGLQNIVSNFVSGIILLVERPVQEGDWIEVSGYSGIVKKIAVRSTRIETFDRFDVIVPNSDLIAGTVKNMTLSNNDGRIVLPVGVAYGSDVERVKDILKGALTDDARIMNNPESAVLFIGLGSSSLDFELRFYLYDVGTTLGVKSDVLFRIYSELNAAGIEIPFPQRDVNHKGLERLFEAVEALAKTAIREKK